MTPDQVVTLSPILQYGALGLCALQLFAGCWGAAMFVRHLGRTNRIQRRFVRVLAGLEKGLEAIGNELNKINERPCQAAPKA